MSAFAKDPRTYSSGDMVAGRYQILGALGKGGFGAVYAAEHTGTRQKIALKMLTMDPDASEDDVVANGRYRTAGWTLIIAGGVIAAGGVGAYAYAVTQANSLRDSDAKKADEFASWDAPASAAIAAGVAFATAGIVTLVLSPDEPAVASLPLAPWGDGRGLTFTTRF